MEEPRLPLLTVEREEIGGEDALVEGVGWGGEGWREGRRIVGEGGWDKYRPVEAVQGGTVDMVRDCALVCCKRG